VEALEVLRPVGEPGVAVLDGLPEGEDRIEVGGRRFADREVSHENRIYGGNGGRAPD
jgi:hypothetical protein